MAEEQMLSEMIDAEVQDFVPKKVAEHKDSSSNKKRSARPKESIEDIINAVAQKEDVITSFKGKKRSAPESAKQNFAYSTEYLRTPEGTAEILYDIHGKLSSESLQKMSRFFAKPWKYLALQFFGGVFFILGASLAAVVVALLAFKLKEVSIIGAMFNKLVYLMRALGK